MSWEFAPNFDAAFRAALDSGKNLVFVCPPAWWSALPLFAKLPVSSSPGIRNIVLIHDAVGLRESAALLDSVEHWRRVHAATGLTRTGRFLRLNQITTLISTPTDLLRFLSRSDLNLNTLQRIVIGWPEMHTNGPAIETLDTILAECRGVQRIVITSDPSASGDFLERHARRAPTTIGSIPPHGPVGTARYSVTDFLRIPEVLSAALDVLNPGTTLVWDPVPESIRGSMQVVLRTGVIFNKDPVETPVDLAVALELPTPEVLQVLQANAQNVLLLIRAFQIPFARGMLTNARPLRLPSETDRALDRASRLRRQIRSEIERNSLTDGFLALTSLFDEFDPATVAAALVSRLSMPDEPEGERADVPTWVRIRIEAGKRQQIRTGDVVGALLNAVELPKNRIGRVDVRDGYSLVEVHTDAADKALKGLNGLQLRGNKLAARLDRR